MEVLLVHGLGRTPLSLLPLATSLRRHGHRSQLFGYRAMTQSWQDIVTRLRTRLLRLARDRADYAVVGHSLGGLLVAHALIDWPSDLHPPHRLFTLGTPVRPPRLLKWAMRFAPYRLATGEAGRRLQQEASFRPLSSLNCDWTAICGTAGWRKWRRSPFGEELNDGLLGVSEARSLAADRTVLLTGLHTFLMNLPSARQHILNSLSQGKPDGISHR